MNNLVVTPLPVAKSLVEQKSDFTAEGSPPPGKVATPTTVNSSESENASPNQRPLRGTITLKRLAARTAP
jgi:hypothetical protein